MRFGGASFGIEEEFLLCSEETGELREDAEDVLARARERIDDGVDHELRAAMLETGTAVCVDANAALRELRAHRDATVEAAAEVGARVLATGSHPWARPTEVDYTDERRYRQLADRFGPVADQALVCGCHVHVEVPSRDQGVAVIDRARPWLAPLLALSANSPLWRGQDTGYASWRTQVWTRWPTAGPTGTFGSLDRYERQADALIASGAAIDRAALYYDMRLSEQWPTVEVRVADVCLDIEDAVVLGVLVRGLVTTSLREIESPPPDTSVELLRAATFMASRWGLGDKMVDSSDWHARPSATVLHRLLEHVRDALDDTGDVDLVTDGVERLLRGADGASRQRQAFERGGPEAVIFPHANLTRAT
jgi:carboxylate-amine ligase